MSGLRRLPIGTLVKGRGKLADRGEGVVVAHASDARFTSVRWAHPGLRGLVKIDDLIIVKLAEEEPDEP